MLIPNSIFIYFKQASISFIWDNDYEGQSELYCFNCPQLTTIPNVI